MPSQVQCRDEGTLRAYLDRQLSAGAQAEVARHLNDCAACTEAAAGLAARAEAVSAALASLTTPAAATAAAYQRFVARHPVQRTSRGVSLLAYASRILSWRVQTMSQNRPFRWQPALLGAVVAVLLFSVIAIAPLRAAASQLLDIFRVHKITVIQVDQSRLDELQNFQGKLFSSAQLPKGQSLPVTSAAQASDKAGFRVLEPGFLPGGLGQAQEFTVEMGGHAQTTVDLNAARALLQMAGISPEGVIPAGRDSIDVSAEVKPIVTQHYLANGKELTIVQGMSPDIAVPADVNLAKVGEAGLQLMGMSPADARKLAGKVDWSSTLVLPVPKNVAAVAEVQVAGTSGYLITENARPAGVTPKAAPARPQQAPAGRAVEPAAGPFSSLVWQRGNLLYMVEGNVDSATLQQIAAGLK